MEKLCSDWHTFYDDIIEYFSDTKPLFLSRIGGSDTDALIDYLSIDKDDEARLRVHFSHHLNIVERYNGFYEFGNDKTASYVRYLNLINDLYEKVKICTFVHSHFLTIYFSSQINSEFQATDIPNRQLLEKIVSELVAKETFIRGYPYNFVESVTKNPFTLFQAFKTILKGKRVLVISPFTESFKYNFSNKNKFFKNGFEYPDFDLITLAAPITYFGMPREHYPDMGWHETTKRLQTEIQTLDFDIALLSCGSYALPLGDFIQRLQKPALYVGGILQLFFGVMGRRYKNPFFTDQINEEVYIPPVESENFRAMLPLNDIEAREAFGAYF